MKQILFFRFFFSIQLFALADDGYYEIIRSAMIKDQRTVTSLLSEYCEKKAKECDFKKNTLETQLSNVPQVQIKNLLDNIAVLAQQASSWRNILLPDGKKIIATYCVSQSICKQSIERFVAFHQQQKPILPPSHSIAQLQEASVRQSIYQEEMTAWASLCNTRNFLHENTPGSDFFLAETPVETPETSASELATQVLQDSTALAQKLLESAQRKAVRLWETGTPFKQE